MRIIFAGGGGASDSVPLDELFARWTAHGTVLYWPFASHTPPETCLEWFKSTYAPLGVQEIVMWRSLDEMEGVDLDAYSGIYIGGGNTFSLLESVRRRVLGNDSLISCAMEA
jgi:dipeptidase E